jgi:cell division protease FtsH
MLVGLMGGRVAEETFFDDITSGAGMDLKEATRIARLMVCSWGMSEALGPQSFGDQQELLFLGREVSRSQNYSEDTSRRIDAEVHRLLDEAHKTATATAATHRDVLKLIAETLIERETLDRVDVEELIEFGRIRTTEERPAVALPENPQPAATPPPLPE